MAFKGIFRVVFALAMSSSLFGICIAIKNGQLDSRCSFPGLAVVHQLDGEILCNGAFVSNKMLYLPGICNVILVGYNINSPFRVYTGTRTYLFEKGSFRGTLFNGMVSVNLTSTPFRENKNDCLKSEGSLYDGTSILDFPTCVIVGYGDSNRPTSQVNFFSGKFRSASITKSTGADCCDEIAEKLFDYYLGGKSYNATNTYNCFESTGVACGPSEFGAPVMCSTTTGSNVVLGLTVFPTCNRTNDLVVHDLTIGAGVKKVKFGFSSEKQP